MGLKVAERQGKKQEQGINNPKRCPKLLTLKQAAELSGLTTWCLRERVWKGELPFYRLGEKKIYVAESDLADYLAGQRQVFGQ